MTTPTGHAASTDAFDPAPSLDKAHAPRVSAVSALLPDALAVGVPVWEDGDVPRELGLQRARLEAAGFWGRLGQTLVLPRTEGPVHVPFGLGTRSALDAARLRDAAAAFARASGRHARLALKLGDLGGPRDGLRVELAAQALVEGVLLSRYRYLPLRQPPRDEAPLEALAVLASSERLGEVRRGLERGVVAARAAALARDLANASASLLTAPRMADVAQRLAGECGLDIEVSDAQALARLGCGGMLGVSAGSAEPPRLIRLSYWPKGARGHVALVGTGLPGDAGGLSPRSGAAAVLASMGALQALGCKTAVTGYLMCADPLPAGRALRLGDVLTLRGGKTVEVRSADAAGRLVLAEGLVLAAEQEPRPDALLDLATLTGACARALGSASAGVLGNSAELVAQVEAAAGRTDEAVWQLPLEQRYRHQLDSEVADLQSLGGEDAAGATTAALFLEAFVDGIPWAHVDMTGTARVERDESWRSRGATGYGARLLIDFLLHFSAPSPRRR